MEKIEIRNQKFMQIEKNLMYWQRSNFIVDLRKAKRLSYANANRVYTHTLNFDDISKENIEQMIAKCDNLDTIKRIIKEEFHLKLVNFLYSSNSLHINSLILSIFSKLLNFTSPFENGALLSIAYSVKEVLSKDVTLIHKVLDIFLRISYKTPKIV